MTGSRRTPLSALLAAGVVAWLAAVLSPDTVEAQNGLGYFDPAPAATLLLPYFEVDFAGDGGATTILTVRNASPEAVVVHATLWTDLARPTLDFDIYLTGYDDQSIDLRDMFANGNLPVTADAQHDPGDTVSPQGPLSQDDSFPNCLYFPYQSPALDALLLQHIRASHTGQFSNVYNGCVGVNHGDGIARGYITLDAARTCSTLFPSAPGYFADGGTADASDDNVLWGDYLILDPANQLVFGDSLVHVGAFPSVANGTWSPSDYTFYGSQVAFSAIDNREPLATSWAAPFLGGDFATDVICWRDPGKPALPQAFPCGTLPAPYPLGQSEVLAFDEQESVQDLSGAVACPYATQRVAVGGANLPTSFSYGWLRLDLNTSTGSPADPIKQAYVGVVSTYGAFAQTGHHAVPLDNALAPIGSLAEIFLDGFESGDTSAWSATVP